MQDLRAIKNLQLLRRTLNGYYEKWSFAIEFSWKSQYDNEVA